MRTCRRVVLIPVMMGVLGGSSQSGSRLWTVSRSEKLYAAGGDAAAHSNVGACQGLAPATRPRRRLITMLISITRTLNPMMKAPMVAQRLRDPQPVSGRYV